MNAGWSAWPAPAKLNLFLRIVGRRADGYHELQTVFRILDWGDCIRLRSRSDGQVVRHGDRLPGVEDPADLAVRAAVLLKNETNVSQGADIHVEKRVPAGGGFGGGSSDAATVLCALDRLWGLNLGEDRLAALGLRLGADVPVFVRGRSAWAEGVGEKLVPLELAPAWYVLVDPGVHVPTVELFRSPDLTRDSPPAKIAGFAAGTVLDNAFEPVLRRREPAVEAAFAELARIGSPRLTGTGSGCFVEFAHRDAAQEALARLPRRMHAWVAAGVSDSPLRAALARLRRD